MGSPVNQLARRIQPEGGEEHHGSAAKAISNFISNSSV